MLFKELFKDILDKEIPDDIAPYFKNQVNDDLQEFQRMKSFVEELEVKVTIRNDKDR